MKKEANVLLDNSGVKRTPKGHFAPGHKPTNLGFRHRATRIKESFCEVYEKLGGTEGLFKWIQSHQNNKREFYKMMLMILPKEIDMRGEGLDTKIFIIREKENATGNHSRKIPDIISGE